MKKKIILTLIGVVCALCCAFGLVACGNDPAPRPLYLLVSETGEQPNYGEHNININITYGEKPDLTKYKLYLNYSNGEIKPLDFNDDKLQVKYSYMPFHTDVETPIDKLPDEYLAGTYTIEYTYDTLTDFEQQAKVYIAVNQAERGAFKVRPTKTTWYENENTPNVVLTNPKNLTVTYVQNSDDTQWQTNDGNGNYELYYIKKTAYDNFTDEQKTDYEFIYNFYSTDSVKTEHEIWPYYSGHPGFEPGEYMLFAIIDKTHNYWNVVSSAVKITVKEVFVGRTFTFQSMVLQDGDGNPVTDTGNEYVAMTESMNTSNQGKTVICQENGEVRGTVDFGNGAFDELTGDDVYNYSYYDTSIFYLINANGAAIAEGKLSGNTLTLKMELSTALYWVITFTC